MFYLLQSDIVVYGLWLWDLTPVINKYSVTKYFFICFGYLHLGIPSTHTVT